MIVEPSISLFRGHKFLEYVDYKQFKEVVEKELSFKAISGEPFDQFYSRFLENHRHKQNDFDKIFFENILYGQLKNVYVSKIKGSVQYTPKNFRTAVKLLIKDINIDNPIIPVNYHDSMSEKGFYLMDSLSIGVSGTKFIAGFDYKTDKDKVTNARFLFVEVVPRKNETEAYFLAGVEIDFTNQVYLIMVRNLVGIEKSDGNESLWDSSINSLYKKINETILKYLRIAGYVDVNTDRGGMFKMCEELDTMLLKDIREEVNKKVHRKIGIFTNEIFNTLFMDESVPTFEKQVVTEKLQALLLGSYINIRIKGDSLRKKAKDLNLIGYPTRINFKSNKASQSSTKSSDKSRPIASSEMFHSLYIDFKQAVALPYWSLSWFSDYKHLTNDHKDVIQTTIVSTSTYFKVVFLARRHLDKEFFHYVIETINRYRGY